MFLGLANLGFLPLQVSGWDLRTSLSHINKAGIPPYSTPRQIVAYQMGTASWPASCPMPVASDSLLLIGVRKRTYKLDRLSTAVISH